MAKRIITYDKIYELLMKEKREKNLQNLGENFFEDIKDYLREKGEILENQEKSGIFVSEIKNIKKQLENAKRLLKELYEKRENKIIEHALLCSRVNEGREVEGLLPEEKEFLNELIEVLNKFRRKILFNLTEFSSKPKELKRENEKNTLTIKFLKDTVSFVDDKKNKYGPFKKGETAEIPLDYAKILLNRGVAIKDENA